jgi:imidazolonepropionase-like amidohydrolase
MTRQPLGRLIARFVTSVVTGIVLVAVAARAADRRPGYLPSVFAIEHAKIVTEPGRMIETGTLVLRNGVIEAVGPDGEVQVPFDAERIDGAGLVAYPGFIDAYSTAGIDDQAKRSRTGSGRTVDYASFALAATPPDNRSGLTPEFLVAEALTLDDAGAKPRRAAGFTSMLVAPGGGIATGQSALVSLSGQPRREIVVQTPVALHLALQSTGAGGYPSTLMGHVAHLRQAMLDAEHYEKSWQHYKDHGGPRPPTDPTLATLRSARRRELPVFWQADTRDEIHRALDLAEEFGVTPVIVGGREAWKVADRLAELKVPVVLRINFPDEPKTTPGSGRFGRGGGERRVTPEMIQQMRERNAPQEIIDRMEQRLAEQKREEAEKPGAEKMESEKSEAEKKAEEPKRKLPESPRLLAEHKRLWAEQLACAGVLAQKGVRFGFTADGQSQPDKFAGNLRKAIEKGLAHDAALAALTRDGAAILGVSDRLGTLAKGRAAHVVLLDGPFHEEKSKLRYAFIDADKFEFNKPSPGKPDKRESKPAKKPDEPKPEAGEQPSKSPEKKSDKPNESEKSKPDQPKADQPKAEKPDSAESKLQQPAEQSKAAESKAAEPAKEPFPTEIDSDRKPSFQTGGNVAIRNATVLTVTNGTLPKAAIVVRDGKIAAIGPDAEVPQGMRVIEAEGLYVMPGIIDTHSHFAISGGVNEMSLSIVPEVRIKDVVNGDDLTIYRALAGGVTAARLLHGSANPIGGQDAVIKLRWGKPGRELIVREGPQGVKFALGENPKRTSSRYPGTRMGVESSIRRSFDEAKAYREIWQRYADARGRGENVLEPRRDLRLEALADITSGKIRIHSHCYRADEILMLLRLAESYGIRVQSLQHVLEGYKVAGEIAAHGASCSTFSDWWAYKIEAFDAIPFNTALLTRAGARVAIKSDDNELMRHLYQEAAKTVKYGGLTEDEALATITINAAAQLGLEQRIGSIEPGKDADLAIFNGHPLNGFARCEMTLVDGEVCFERRGEHKPSGHGSPLPAAELRARQVEVRQSAAGKYALVNARIVPVVGSVIERGTLLVSGGKIQALAGADLPVPEGFISVDLAGLSVYPGMVNAGGALGLSEIGSADETHDYSERGAYNADVRAAIAVHPDSELIPVSRANGILTVLTQPTGGTISGQSALLNLAGWIPPEMALCDPCALHINFPRGTFDGGASRSRSGPPPASGARTAENQIDELKERFRLALRYDAIRQHARQNGDTAPVPDPQLDALVPYAKAELPVMIHADRHGDILEAIEFAEELKLKWILSGADDAWKCVQDLKKHNVPVILGPSMQLPAGPNDPYDAPYSNAARLHEAGVRFAIKAVDSGPGSATSTRNLPYQAAMAVAYGLPPEEGLKAVTLYPAQILSVADRLGSIEVGKLANLVICDSHPLQPTTEIKALFIAGKPLAPTSKHTQLYARYQERLKQVRDGKVMLGVKGTQAASATAAGAAN